MNCTYLRIVVKTKTMSCNSVSLLCKPIGVIVIGNSTHVHVKSKHSLSLFLTLLCETICLGLDLLKRLNCCLGLNSHLIFLN